MSSLSEVAKAITPGGRIGDDSPVGTPGGKQNWVDRAGGLPKYIRMVAHAFMRKGKSESRAIEMAVGVVRNWAEGKGNVSAKVQAAAAAAIAEWNAKRGAGRVAKRRSVSDEEFLDITKSLIGKCGKLHPDCGCSPAKKKRYMKKHVHKAGCGCEEEPKKKRKIKKRFVSMDERKSGKTATYPGTTSFPVANQSDFNNAWNLRGKSKKVPKEKVEAWLRRLAKKEGYSIPGETKKSVSILSKREFNSLVKEINADTFSFSVEGEIEKRNDEQQMVFGWCSIAKHADGTVEVDKQGDVLEDIDQMEKVAYDFVLHSRDGGEMHVRKGVSTLVESFVSTPEKWEAMGIPEGTLPVGWWVGFHVHDQEVWKGVKSGKYKMFSVHGSGMRKAMEDAE